MSEIIGVLDVPATLWMIVKWGGFAVGGALVLYLLWWLVMEG